MKNEHVFSKALANILFNASKCFEKDQPFHLQTDLMLTKNQYNNFQKLQYWGFIKKYYENGKRQGGYWCLTDIVYHALKGAEFPRSLKTFNNKVVETSSKATTLTSAIGYYDLPEKWAQRAEPIEIQQKRWW